jgi:hypothetical protein
VKKAYHYTSWRLTEEGKLCGVNFGYDFCAEHEAGIAGIRESFGIKTYTGNATINSIKKLFGALKPTLGIEARVITVKPPELQFVQKGDFCCIYYSSAKISMTVFDEGIKSLAWEMTKPGGKDLMCYWGDNSFMLITTQHEYFQAIKKGFLDLNIAIFTAGKFGLVICLPNMVDIRTKTDMYASDFTMLELRRMSDDIGIEKDLLKAKKQFFALKPGWKNPATKEIHFWLNPVDQTKYNYGWFTEAELREWIKEQGPVIKKVEEVKMPPIPKDVIFTNKKKKK